MRKAFILILLTVSASVWGQSKSITRFRATFKESSNMFFYSSTLKMLNTENNPDLADLLKAIEEIRVLNYDKATRKFSQEDILKLKKDLQDEDYNDIMTLQENGNSVYLYNREKRGKNVGFAAIVENRESLVLIDLIGNMDVKKFMELKRRLDSQKGTQT